MSDEHLDATGAPLGLSALWPYLRSHRSGLLLAGMVSFVAAGFGLATPLLTRAVISNLQEQSPIAVVIVLLVVSVVGGAVLNGVVRYLLERTAQGVVLQTRVDLAGRLLRLPQAQLDRRRTGDLISRIGADTTLLSAVVTSGLVELASGAVFVVGTVVLMALVDPLLLGVTLVAVGVGIGVVLVVSTRARPLSEAVQAAVGDMTAAVERALGAVSTVRASRAEDRETERVAAQARSAYDAGLRLARLQALIGPLGNVAVQAAFLAVVGVGGARVATGSISVGDLVAFVLLMFLLVVPLVQGITAYTTIQTGLGALTRIEEILALAPEDADEVGLPASVPGVPGAPLLRLEDVSFGYPGGERGVLHDVSFTVERGSRVALVGPSGAGKSTVLALIERSYDVDAGALRYDGVDVRSMTRRQLRSRIGYVEQEAPVLAGTIRDNLRLVDATADDGRLFDVLDAVNLGGIVDRAAHGLDTEVGDRGVLLSGGERQRLAIARVLLDAPDLLLLDEPTASLDARNEAALRTAIDAAADRCTLVVVAHRLSTVADADAIVVLDHGRVIATGTHEELIATSPLYREFATQQLLV